MPTKLFNQARRWLAIIPIAIIVISVGVWFATRDTLPKTIRIATANQNGLYHEFGTALGKSLEKRTDSKALIVATAGSVENSQLLTRGEVDVAIIQGGSAPISGMSAIAPLYPEIVHVIGRPGFFSDPVAALKSERVILGAPGSGMRRSSARLLGHFGIEDKATNQREAYFMRLQKDQDIDGAIVTTGFMNRDLQALLGTGEFVLSPLSGAEAIATKDPYFRTAKIPRGIYRESPGVPDTTIETVATTALLVVRKGESEALITALLEATYREGLGLEFAALIPTHEAIAKSPVPLHETARHFFNPPDQIGQLAAVMESVAAFKELSFAFAAGLYLMWTRWRRLKEVETAKALQRQKDRLDEFLEKTLVIEREQMDTDDPARLKVFLDRVTEIKLEALGQLTHEELRSDQAFSIFIVQCANLINKIQWKIVHGSLKS